MTGGRPNSAGTGRIVVTGSIATDHLLRFPGRIAEQILPDRLGSLSLSLLADQLDIHRGGVAANIALGLRRLGHHPLLVAAVGTDFADYGAWLTTNGVETGWLRGSTSRYTARFLCTTDRDGNQLATFYPGAMREAREIDLTPLLTTGTAGLVLVSPNDPEAMLRHTAQCRALGHPFAADPSQQLALLDRGEIRQLVDGADLLFTNDYEAGLLTGKSGWSDSEVLDRVGGWVTTHGAAGVRIRRRGAPERTVPAVPGTTVLDPTGGGDAFRAGFLAGLTWGLADRRSAQVGCVLASCALAHIGSQEYAFTADEFARRLAGAYGNAAAAEVRAAAATPTRGQPGPT